MLSNSTIIANKWSFANKYVYFILRLLDIDDEEGSTQ